MRANSDWPGRTGQDPHFDNILNLRDVGKTINQVTGKKYLFISLSLSRLIMGS
jgi:hypothetical protein